MKILGAVTIGLLLCTQLLAQKNIISTSATAENIMRGQYDPALFSAPFVVRTPDALSGGINAMVSADSIRSNLEKLATFYNRNTGSDTASGTRGIGAARRWVYGMFQSFSTTNNNRLVPSYLQ